LPTHLTLFRQKLFGNRPDRDMRNYRLHQYTQILHSTELEEYVYYADKRVTYLEHKLPELFDSASYTPRIIHAVGSGEFQQLQVLGRPSPPDENGQIFFQYRIELLDTGDVDVATLPGRLGQELTPANFSQGLSEEIDLPGSGYKARVPEQEAGVWIVIVRNRPQWDLGQIALLLENLGEENYLRLFGANPAEPYRTFSNLWSSDKPLPYRFGAFLLALAFRTDEIRQKLTGTKLPVLDPIAGGGG
jgi:hypothetical protein